MENVQVDGALLNVCIHILENWTHVRVHEKSVSHFVLWRQKT